MRTVFEACKPREEVITGELVDDLFAAELTPVITGKAPDVYKDPPTFFANTYPTQGLQALIREVFSRLSGEGGNPLIRLETTFGGGKSHGLIALYHLAIAPDRAPTGFLPPGLRPKQPVRVAAVVGRDFGTNGQDHGGVHVNTFWGEIAWQLGGLEAYKLVASSDRQMIAPGANVLRQVIGDEPTLIMIDEIGNYLRRAAGVSLAGAGTLADQVAPFIQALAAAVSQNPRAVLILTLTTSGDPYAEENEKVRQVLDELGKVTARQELVLRPTRDDEVAHVVCRRLFAEIDRDAAQQTADAYVRYLERQEEAGAPIPPRAAHPNYRDQIERSYPFHPELLRVLMTKTATIPNFHRTRGALRLLARVIRRIWSTKPENCWLIHPYHVDLGDENIRTDLTDHLGEDRAAFGPVIEADIYSASGGAHAQEVDEDFVARGKPPLGSWVARVVFLHSLTHGEAGKAEVPEIVLACAQPDLDPALITNALETLESGTPGKRCWYLHTDGERYWFSKEAGLGRLIDEERDQVTTAQAKEEVRTRIRQMYKTVAFEAVFFPEGPEHVDDTEGKLKLCIVDFDVVDASAIEPADERLVKTYNHAGTSGGFRQYKNSLVFLVADKGETAGAIEAARTFLALRRIVNSPDLMAQLNQTAQRKAREEMKKKELDVLVAVARAYRHLYYPEPSEPQTGLRQTTLDIEKAAKLEQQKKPGYSAQEQVIIEALREVGKLMSADGPGPAPDLVIDFAWPHGQQTMTTGELVRAFYSRPSLPMLQSVHRLRETVTRGVEDERWVYLDGQRIYTREGGAPAEADVKLDDEHELWLLAEAARRGYCFRCGRSPCQCKRVGPPIGPPPPGPPKPRFTTPEPCAPQKAFQQMLDWATDHKIDLIDWIKITIEDSASPGELQQLWTGMTYLVPVDQSPERLLIAFSAGLEFAALQQHGEAAETTADTCTLDYNGTAHSFRALFDFFRGYAERAHGLTYTVSFAARLVRPLAPDAGELKDLRDRLVDGGVERIKLEAQPALPQQAEE